MEEFVTRRNGSSPDTAGSNPGEASPPRIEFYPPPTIPFGVTLRFWWSFLVRHYGYGAGAGLYGPPSHQAFLKRVERQLAEFSVRKGNAPTYAIPSVDCSVVSPGEFQRNYLAPNTPVVLRGMASEWPAVQTWNLEFFRSRYGQQVVPTRLRGDGFTEEDLRYVEMPLADLIEDILRGGTAFGGHLEDLWHRNPELRSSIDLSVLERYLCAPRLLFPRKLSRIQSLQLFLSGAGTRTGFHCAGGPNLFVMVQGRKRWTMVEPRFTKWMYPVTRKDMFYVASPVPWMCTDEELEERGFPLYLHAPKYTTTLESGDVLFSPQWWWHAVETTEPSIGIACRTINQLFLGHPLFSAMWVGSGVFVRLLTHILRTGWGSDSRSGAKVAFEKEVTD